MAVATALMTADEFSRLPSRDGKVELVRGEVVYRAPAGGEHGGLQVQLAVEMKLHERRSGLRFVVTEVGFRLFTDPDTVRAPDIAYVEAGALPEGRLPTGFIAGAPALAVEVISPTDTHQEVEEKVAEYLAAGTKLVWLLHPKPRSVTVRRPDGTAQTLRGDDTLSGEDVFPGFRIRVRDLFS